MKKALLYALLRYLAQMNASVYRSIMQSSGIGLRALCIIICSISVFSCNSSKDSIKEPKRETKLDLVLNREDVKYVYSFPVVWAFGDYSFYLVVTQDGKCLITQGRQIKERRDSTGQQEIEYLIFREGVSKRNLCGKMLNDSTLAFKTDLFGEIEVSVDYSPDFDGKGVDIDFVLGKDNQGNRWSMTCTNWSFRKGDSVYTDYQAVYPKESALKIFPHKKGHVFIPATTEKIDAVRVFPGIMGGNFEILLNDIESSSYPFVKDKRKSSSQEINKIIITHNISDRKSRQLVGRITSKGLVILSKQGNPTKQILTQIYPPNNSSAVQRIFFGAPEKWEHPVRVR